MSLVSLIKNAVQESAPELTKSLRKSAYDQGWPADCGRSLLVTCDGTSFDIQMSEAAEDREFGFGKEPPSPAVRRWSNDTSSLDAAILGAVERRLDGVL